MIRPVRCLLLLLACGIVCRSGFAHGGVYVRPPRLGPVTGIDPRDSAPGDNGTTSPVNFGGLVGGPSARRAATTPGFSFEAWWQANGPSLLAELAPPDAAAGGRTSPAVDADWPPIAGLFQDALQEQDADIVDSAIVAQGRSIHGDAVATAFRRVSPFIDHPHESVRRSAIIALGLLRHEDARPLLTNLLDPTSPSDQVSNGIAAVALGMLSNPSSIAELLRVLDRDDAKPELHCGVILGLGLFTVDRERITAALIERLDDTQLAVAARAQIPIALGRLDEAAVPAIAQLAALAQRGESTLRASAVIALGRLAAPDDRATLDLLRGLAERSSPPELRQLACISLGRIAARASRTPGIDLRGLADVRGFLRRTVSALGPRAPFAAIALAMSCRADAACDARERTHIVASLRDALRARDADSRSAAAIALGLLADAESADALRAMLHPRESGDLAGGAAIALGLLRDEYAVGGLRTLLLSPAGSFAARERAAWALGRIDRPLVTRILSREFDGAATLSESTFYARMLGTLGDDATVPALIRRARDPAIAPLERAFAIVGLGRLLERSEVPWNARLSVDANLLETCQVERALLDIF